MSWVVLALFVALAGPGDAVGELVAPDAERARAAAEALRALGSKGHELLWEGFAAAPADERRARSHWLVDDGRPDSVRAATGSLADPDPGVRANLVRYLGRAASAGDDDRARRIEALLDAGRVETEAAPRAAIGDALLAIGSPAAGEALAELIALWPTPERTRLADRLAELFGADELVARLVRAGFARDPMLPRTPDDVLAALLPAYARHLADRDAAETPRDRAPLALGMRHPSATVRDAAEAAVDASVARLRLLDRPKRADALLAALAREGPRPELGEEVRALQALQEGLDPALALEAAREIERLSTAGVDRAARRWRFRAAYLAAAAELAAGDAEACGRELDVAQGRLDALLAERAGLVAGGGVDEELDLMHRRALLDLMRAVKRLASGGNPSDTRVLELLRSAHEEELEAQRFALGHDRAQLATLDVLFDADTSPARLVFARKPHAAWPVEKSLALELALGRALATVAPREMLGFEPFAGALPGRADPLEDPPRRALLSALLSEQAELAQREYREATDRLRERMSQGGEVGADDEQRLMRLWQTWQVRLDAAEAGDLLKSYDDLRAPSSLALRLAQDLSEEGRTGECRALARAALDAIEKRELEQRFAWGLELAAELEMTIGSAWTADGEAAQAEAELEKAVERLQSLEDFYVERGAPALGRVARSTRSSALVSLAVNANVKQKDVAKALGYFEKAYALRQDDFMKVLLACYRARSGKEAEARELLGQVPLAPRFYYNLACTYALLGDRERALDLLQRELEENHPSPGSLEQQKGWAREDPDLESLRDDPRFQHLVAASAEGAER